VVDRKNGGQVIIHDIYGTPGNSGSPIWELTGGFEGIDKFQVGVHTGFDRQSKLFTATYLN